MSKLIEIGARTGRAVRCVRILGFMLLIGLLPGCIVEYQDSNVQVFEAGEAAVLDGKQLYLTQERARFDNVVEDGRLKITRPWGMPPYYYRAVTEQSEFLVDPASHQTIDFSVSDPFLVPESDRESIGLPHFLSGVYVGSDGTIAFNQPGAGNESLEAHFSARQFSLLPMDATVDGARVSYALIFRDSIPDVLVVTYENADGNSVQFVLIFWPGNPSLPGMEDMDYSDIVVTYRDVTETVGAGVVGVSWLSLDGREPEFVNEFLAGFEEDAGGQANLIESTDTTTGGRVMLPLP